MRESNRSFVWCAVASAALAITGESRAGNIFTPGDPIIAIDRDGGFSDAAPPANEGPANLIDRDYAVTKYLNFGEEGSGIIITATNAAVAKRIGFITANDAAERDPITMRLYGTNSAISSTTGSAGKSEPWTLIYSGPTNLESVSAFERGFPRYVDIPTNSASYKSYKAVFPTVRDSVVSNSAQLTEMQLYTGTGANNIFEVGEGTIFDAGNAVVAIDEWQSRYPAAENPKNVIDGNGGTKYLNFGDTNSGFIVTPSKGATVARSFQIITGNDSSGRDPAKYEIYGTNGAVTDLDNSNGDSDDWSLIATGDLALPTARNALSDTYGFDNDLSYTSYKILFPALRGTNSEMQLSEFILSDTAVPEPGAAGALAVGAVALIGRRRRRRRQ